MRERAVDCRGLSLNVTEWGPASGQVLVLHHGFLDHSRGWDPLARKLSAHYRILAPDARGHGNSGWVGQGGYYYFQDYVADLYDVLEALAPGAPPILVGHSMGGMVCSLFAGTYPDRVRALVSVEGAGPPGLSPADAPFLMAQWIRGVRKQKERRARPFNTVEEAAQRLRAYNPRLSSSLAHHLARHGTREAATGAGYVWKFDPVHRTRGPMPFLLEQARAFWLAVTCPTLLVKGESTPFSWDPDENRECIHGAETVVVPGAGHMVHHDQPEALSCIIREFVESRVS